MLYLRQSPVYSNCFRRSHIQKSKELMSCKGAAHRTGQKLADIRFMWLQALHNLLDLIILTTFMNIFKYHVFAPMGGFQLELIYLYFPPSFHLRVVVSALYASRCYNNIFNRSCGCWRSQLPKPGDRSKFNTPKTCWKCYNNERPTGQKQQLLDGRMLENKGKLILTEILPSVQKLDI